MLLVCHLRVRAQGSGSIALGGLRKLTGGSNLYVRWTTSMKTRKEAVATVAAKAI